MSNAAPETKVVFMGRKCWNNQAHAALFDFYVQSPAEKHATGSNLLDRDCAGGGGTAFTLPSLMSAASVKFIGELRKLRGTAIYANRLERGKPFFGIFSAFLAFD